MIQLLGPQLLGPQLLGLGADPIDAFLLQHPKPSSTDIAELLKAYTPAERPAMAQALIGRGVSSKTIAAALNWLEASSKIRSNWPAIAGVLALASAGISGYHGFKRNGSVWGGLLWFFLGSLFPVITPIAAIALPPGFAKPKKG